MGDFTLRKFGVHFEIHAYMCDSLISIPFQTLLHWCCGTELKQVKVVPVLSYILLDWRIWHKAPPGVWEAVLTQLEQLLISPSKGIVSQTSVNWCSFLESAAITKLLMTSKVYSA